MSKSLNLNVSSDNWEGLLVEAKTKDIGKKFDISNIYRPPKSNNNGENITISSFIDDLAMCINKLETSGNVFLAGDFNIDLLKIDQVNIYHQYLEILSNNDFVPMITKPT